MPDPRKQSFLRREKLLLDRDWHKVQNRTAPGVYIGIAWTPFLLLLVAFTMYILVGMIHFEARTWGTEWFLENDGSVNLQQVHGYTSDEALGKDVEEGIIVS